MLKLGTIFLWLSAISLVTAQEASLPVDFRQHNLTEYNSSLFNPAFSLDRNNPQSVSLWTRWQWQTVDADPTSLFLNYSRKLGESSAVSAAFFQHNTGVFFNTGGILNYAHEIRLTSLIRLGVGINVFGFQQELADDRFPVNPNIPLPQLGTTNDFIMQLAPGIRLFVENFAFGLASENLFDYNFSESEGNTVAADKVYMAMVSYDLPIMRALDPTAFLRPSLYLRTIPELQNQVGASMLLSHSKYWGQLGYNNFYGISAGGGGTFLKRFSLGALVEFGTNSQVSGEDPSFEIIASYFIGKPEERRKIQQLYDDPLEQEVELITDSPKEEEEKMAEAAKEEKAQEREAKKLAAQERALEKQRRKDSVEQAKRQKKALAEQEEEEKRNAIDLERERRLAEQKVLEQRRADSLAAVGEARALAAQTRRRDSLAQAEAAQKALEQKQLAQEDVTPQKGEKYEEVRQEGSLEPGFYLITNVFGTKRYYEAFMAELKNRGLQPKSFLRSKNNYNYIYLERYDTMNEARKARDSNFNGKYQDSMWIFRVTGE
ncbi:MAG: PorP/SprF family type IX secretion system membrane protein [Bacteroidota bacterium]